MDENTLLQRPTDAAVEPAEPVEALNRAGATPGPETGPGAPDTDRVAPEPGPGAEASPEQAPNAGGGQTGTPGFAERGRMRRRIRFLRKARELAYRDLGGLVFDLHRFGQRNDPLVLAKLDTIGRIDGELRTLENVLAERRPVTILREAGIAACPRCAAIHGSDDRFCPNCGLAMDVNAERPVAGSAAPASVFGGPPATGQPFGAPPAQAQTAVSGSVPAPASAAVAAPSPTSSLGATSTPAATPAGSRAQASTDAPAGGKPSGGDPAKPPAPSNLPPAGPAPGVGDGGPGSAEGGVSGADQPTEIIRPPQRGT